MKTIEITNLRFERQKITFEDRLAILTGHNRSGKTLILEQIADALKEGSNHVLIDQQPVQRGQFQVAYLSSETRLKDEIKLTKTSSFRNHLISKINHLLINDQNYQQLSSQIDQLANKIEELTNLALNPHANAFTNQNIKLKFDTSKFSLEKIVDKLLNIDLINQINQNSLDEKSFNSFLLRMVVFNVLLAGLNFTDLQRPIVILIDDPAAFANYQTLTEFAFELRKLLKFENLYICIATSNADFVQQMNCKISAIHYIKNRQIIDFKNYQTIIEKAITIFSFWKSTDHQNWQAYQIALKPILETEDLEREFALFWQSEFLNWFKMLFANQITFINESELIKFDSASEKFNLISRSNYKNQIILFCFAKAFEIKTVFSEKNQQKYQKINFLWS